MSKNIIRVAQTQTFRCPICGFLHTSKENMKLCKKSCKQARNFKKRG